MSSVSFFSWEHFDAVWQGKEFLFCFLSSFLFVCLFVSLLVCFFEQGCPISESKYYERE